MSACCVLSLWACDKSPARVDLEFPGFVLSANEVPLKARVATKGGDPLPDVRPTFAVAPSDLAVVTASGAVRCLKSGDGTLTATAGAATSTEEIKCRLVESLKVPKALRVILGNEPVQITGSAHDASGAVLQDVPVKVESSNPNVFSLQGMKIAPAAVGTANLIYKAGDKTASVPVTVVRKLKADPLLLNDGARTSWSLNQ